MFKRVFKMFSSGKPKRKEVESEADKTAAGRYEKLREGGGDLRTNVSSEKLCGITKGMSQEEIDKRLTELYRRHNRAASSLDAKLREEAEVMLDTIVELRMKYRAPSGTKG